ncbi:guanylate cyclase [Azospirillum argentinense]|uniref:Guanylate cyclase n=1 Tax=Azospirillum argentinense TaxID=2970906 RepID=A0A060DCD3_9PROT|nr:adenylate/guanylate cyclase domain-containing protein [Azospirillum argentinense]AIB10492.1 guanylate cyclase [Azospirillum argentinense]EZQ07482.1 guanylate cyclase [Azospirillum argentinense]PNQ98512.1 adenylate/guanylate cyclase domain-containing protein [Azospirillum argentinense]
MADHPTKRRFLQTGLRVARLKEAVRKKGGPRRTRPPALGRPRLRLPIAAVLVAGFGSLMLLAVASVLVLGLVSASRNTFALLNDRADLALSGVEVRIRNQLNPARDMARFVAGLMERGELDPADSRSLQDTLRGALAGAPDVTGIAFFHPDRTGLRADRLGNQLHIGREDLRHEPELGPELRNGSDRTTAVWADPLWSKEAGTSFVTLFQPVRRNGTYLGQVVVGVSLGDLSRFLSTLYVEQGLNAFVLFDRQHVLAHPSLAGMKFDFSTKTDGPPLPRIDQVADPALAALWQTGQPVDALKKRVEGRLVNVLDEDYLFLMRSMAGYGQQDWTIGISFRANEASAEVRRLYTTGLAGLGILLISVAVALIVGRRISTQVAHLAEAADHVRTFDFRAIDELPDSRLRELARANSAFNAMVAGLRWFETYVPKALVLRLMHRRGGLTSFQSEEREVTVMFTDIRGFSRMAEHMGAADTAALLNEHFTLLANCIEAEGGTVDKFIGDAIMAFWGAPEEQPDHAARALRAAHAITRAVREGNRRRAAEGLPAIRVRIGLHSGPVVVGNIGSASRINYTIVGDTVNVAARIEELASALQGDEEVIVLSSAATAFQGDGAAPLDCVGDRTLRGRTGTTEVWRVTLDGDGGGDGAGAMREEEKA